MSKPSLTLEELAAATGSQLVGDPRHRIQGVADLASAQSSDASFYTDTRYAPDLAKSQAGVIITDHTTVRTPDHNYLIAEYPEQAFQQVSELISSLSPRLSGFVGVHPSAVIHPSVKLGKDVCVGPLAVIDQGVTIGDRTVIGPHCCIGVDVTIGADCLLHPHVILITGTIIGNRVILQPGVVIGSCGFGYRHDAKGNHIKLLHVGNVVVEDDVEIGSNTTIDRARFNSTRIGRGTKIDNLVQIAHNVCIGEQNIIISQVGIAGSSTTGKHVILAGRVGVNDHVEIGNNIVVAAFSGVSKSLNKPGRYGGVPAIPLADYNRKSVLLRNIDKLVERVEKLEHELGSRERNPDTD